MGVPDFLVSSALVGVLAQRLCRQVCQYCARPVEDPVAILSDVERGLDGLGRVDASQLDRTERSYALVVDRREAIALALSIARSEDTVILAGKGHEDYQIIGRERLPFDDRVEARRALERRSP